MKSGSTAGREQSAPCDLDSRYGEVGISAVAAALHYQSDAKNAAYARVETQPDDRFVNAAA